MERHAKGVDKELSLRNKRLTHWFSTEISRIDWSKWTINLRWRLSQRIRRLNKRLIINGGREIVLLCCFLIWWINIWLLLSDSRFIYRVTNNLFWLIVLFFLHLWLINSFCPDLCLIDRVLVENYIRLFRIRLSYWPWKPKSICNVRVSRRNGGSYWRITVFRVMEYLSILYQYYFSTGLYSILSPYF